MKLVFHAPGHHKNVDGIMRMCKSRNIDLEITNDDSRVFINNYDILVLNSRFIKPSDIPKIIKIIYGPQHWVFPSGDIFGEPDPLLNGRCVYNTLSKWVEQVNKEFPSAIMPYGQFPYAVDIDKFNPGNKEKTFDLCNFNETQLIQSII